MRENIELRTELAALRERAQILGERLYETVEHRSSGLESAHPPVSADQPAYPLFPPGRDAEIDSILDWFYEQSARLGPLEDELPGGGADVPVSLASAPPPSTTGAGPRRTDTVLRVAEMRPGG